MKMLLSLLLSMSSFTSCQQSEGRTLNPIPATAQTILNVSYGKDSLQKMDVYLPANRSIHKTPSLVLIHGGSWNGGSKSDFNQYVDSFKKRLPHYAIFNLNYRLVNGGHTFPAQENDIKLAIDFIAGKAEDYKIDINHLVLLGASAGGHLALLHAYKYTDPKIAAVIDFFGPTDLLAMYTKPWHPYLPFALQMVTGATPGENEELYYQSSPVNFVSATAPPTLILHGAKDPVVDISQSKSLNQRLEKAGVKHELVVYPSQRHGWHGSTLTNSFDRIGQFLKTAVE
jgi:acetyl esterase/lipase